MFELTSVFQRISKFNLEISLLLTNNFIEPLSQFQLDSSKHNYKMFKELETLVTNLEKNKKTVKASREAYYQMCSNADKSEDRLKQILEKVDKGTYSKMDLGKETEKTAQLKVFAQEAKADYETKCKESSQAWADFKERFFIHFETFDLKEENRIDIIKRKALTLCNDLRNLHKNENPIPDLKVKFKDIDSQNGGKKPKSIVDLVFGAQSIDKFKIDRKEEFISYERYKVEREQRMFDESFYIVDMEDSTEEEIEDIKLLVTIIFNNFQGSEDQSRNSRRRQLSNEMSEENSLATTSIPGNRLVDDNQNINPVRVERLFQKGSLRDTFIKECIKRIPEKKTLILMNSESFLNIATALKAVVTNMAKANERDPAKFIDLLRILNTFYSKNGENKKYLFQQLGEVTIFKDITMYSLVLTEVEQRLSLLAQEKEAGN